MYACMYIMYVFMYVYNFIDSEINYHSNILHTVYKEVKSNYVSSKQIHISMNETCKNNTQYTLMKLY